MMWPAMLFFLLLASTGLACYCGTPFLDRTYCTSGYIANVQIMNVSTSPDRRQKAYDFVEIKKFKGNSQARTFRTASIAIACGIYPLTIGKEYLIAFFEVQKKLSASACLSFPVEGSTSGPIEWKNVPQNLTDIFEKNPPVCLIDISNQ